MRISFLTTFIVTLALVTAAVFTVTIIPTNAQTCTISSLEFSNPVDFTSSRGSSAETDFLYAYAYEPSIVPNASRWLLDSESRSQTMRATVATNGCEGEQVNLQIFNFDGELLIIDDQDQTGRYLTVPPGGMVYYDYYVGSNSCVSAGFNGISCNLHIRANVVGDSSDLEIQGGTEEGPILEVLEIPQIADVVSASSFGFSTGSLKYFCDENCRQTWRLAGSSNGFIAQDEQETSNDIYIRNIDVKPVSPGSFTGEYFVSLEYGNAPDPEITIFYTETSGVYSETNSIQLNRTSESGTIISSAIIPNDIARGGSDSEEVPGGYLTFDYQRQYYVSARIRSSNGDEFTTNEFVFTAETDIDNTFAAESTGTTLGQSPDPAGAGIVLPTPTRPGEVDLDPLVNYPGVETISKSSSLGELVNVIFKLIIGSIIVMAIVMLFIGAVNYMLAGSSPSKKSAAKKRIWGALAGVGLALGSYLILWTINPQLVRFNFDPGTEITIEFESEIDTRPIVRDTGERICGNKTVMGEPVTYGMVWADNPIIKAGDERMRQRLAGIDVVLKRPNNCTHAGRGLPGSEACTSMYYEQPAEDLVFERMQQLQRKCTSEHGGRACRIVVTGGTECWLHSSHAPNRPFIDLRSNAEVQDMNETITPGHPNFIGDGRNHRVPGIPGKFKAEYAGQFANTTAGHWHVEFE